MLYLLLGYSAITSDRSALRERIQGLLPLNPQQLPGLEWTLAFNTAVSFVTNTNWQSYGGESTMGYLVQMAGLTVQNFASAATGIALAVALVRGFTRAGSATIGNFWADVTRITLYLLLPICVVYAIFLIANGVPQTLAGSVDISTLEGVKQTLALGPVASQEAIKMLGTNGGGFFNANSAHPFENPTPLSNFLQVFSIFVIPAALCVTLGEMVKNRRHGWAVFGAMLLISLAGIITVSHFEQQGNPVVWHEGVNALATAADPSGNMEGKEVRFGIPDSSLFAVVTTDASCGAVNSMHDSYTPLGGLVPLLNIQLGEVVFGGVGAGMYGVLIYVLMADHDVEIVADRRTEPEVDRIDAPRTDEDVAVRRERDVTVTPVRASIAIVRRRIGTAEAAKPLRRAVGREATIRT